MSELSEGIVDVTGAFSSGDHTVINWGGKNYYMACDEPVVENADGGGTFCVKRMDHPGDIHEDYDGIRKTTDKGRMTVVVTFTIPEGNTIGHEMAQNILRTLKPQFKEQPDVKVYGAVRDKADQIIMILEGDG